MPWPKESEWAAEEVDVHIARPAVGGEFEVVVFDIGQRVAHLGFAGGDGLRPDFRRAALDGDAAGDALKIRMMTSSGPMAHMAQFGAGEIEVVFFSRRCGQKIRCLGHADAHGVAVGIDNVKACDFCFLATVFGKGGDIERLVMATETSPVPL